MTSHTKIRTKEVGSWETPSGVVPHHKQSFDHLKFWHHGEKLTKKEHDALSWEKIEASNKIVGRPRDWKGKAIR